MTNPLNLNNSTYRFIPTANLRVNESNIQRFIVKNHSQDEIVNIFRQSVQNTIMLRESFTQTGTFTLSQKFEGGILNCRYIDNRALIRGLQEKISNTKSIIVKDDRKQLSNDEIEQMKSEAYGSLSPQEADQIIANQENGTYLLRRSSRNNEDDDFFSVTWKSELGTIQHQRLSRGEAPCTNEQIAHVLKQLELFYGLTNFLPFRTQKKSARK